jgi:hypothetical protein
MYFLNTVMEFQNILETPIDLIHHFGSNDNGYSKFRSISIKSCIQFNHISISTKRVFILENSLFFRFRKKWDEMINSSHELSKSMRIIFLTIRYDGTLKQIISHISSVAEIYHLQIYEEVYTDMFIEILDLLPELISVQIPSL